MTRRIVEPEPSVEWVKLWGEYRDLEEVSGDVALRKKQEPRRLAAKEGLRKLFMDIFGLRESKRREPERLWGKDERFASGMAMVEVLPFCDHLRDWTRSEDGLSIPVLTSEPYGLSTYDWESEEEKRLHHERWAREEADRKAGKVVEVPPVWPPQVTGKVLEICERHADYWGLCYGIWPRWSWHYPGHTTLVWWEVVLEEAAEKREARRKLRYKKRWRGAAAWLREGSGGGA